MCVGGSQMPLPKIAEITPSRVTVTYDADSLTACEGIECNVYVSTSVKGKYGRLLKREGSLYHFKVFPNVDYTAFLRVSCQTSSNSYSDSENVRFKTPGTYNFIICMF